MTVTLLSFCWKFCFYSLAIDPFYEPCIGPAGALASFLRM